MHPGLALGLEPEKDEGSAWSEPIRLPTGDFGLWLNAEGAHQITVELADEKFRPLPDFSGEKAGRTQAERGLDCRVDWPAQSLASVQGKTVRLRFHLRKANSVSPRLFAVYLRE